MIAAGNYRHRVTVQQLATTEDELGQVLPTWTNVLTSVYACVEDLSGRELVAAQEIHGAVQASIRMRYRGSVQIGMRVVYKQKIYTIEAIIQADALAVEMILFCSLGVVQ